jgi:putative proteasome-type protease
MTYCVGMLLGDGFVMAADTRTNAGVDNVGRFRKLHTWEKTGEALFVLLTAGNLAITQAVVSLLTEGAGDHGDEGENKNLFKAKTMFQAVRIVGRAIREVKKIDGEALSASGDAFAASYIFAGQIKGEQPRLFQIYAEGNFIEATADTPFFQIGEHKYGKPILDRVATQSMKLDAAKLVLLSFDSTLRSNLSVGLPIDMLTYESDTLKLEHTKRIGQDDPYFKMLSAEWSKALRTAFANIEAFDI